MLGKGPPHTAQRAAVAGSQVPPSRRARSLFSGRGGREKLLGGELRIAAYCCASRALQPPSPPLPGRSAHRQPPGALPPAAGPTRPRFSTADSGGSGGVSTRVSAGEAAARGSAAGARRERGSLWRAGSRPGALDGAPALGRPGKPPAGVPTPETAAFLRSSQHRARCHSPTGARSQRKPHLGPLNFSEPNACRSREQTR